MIGKQDIEPQRREGREEFIFFSDLDE